MKDYCIKLKFFAGFLVTWRPLLMAWQIVYQTVINLTKYGRLLIKINNLI